MNKIADVSTQTPIEIALGVDENGMTTARKLYDFLELNPGNYARWCKSNITDNEFAEENVDYKRFDINVEGSKENSSSMKSLTGRGNTEDYKLTAHFAKKLSMKGNGERAEQAREYFTTVEERVKQRTIDYAQLSPELQMFSQIFNSVAQQQLEQKRQARQLNRIEEKQDTLTETFQKSSNNEDFKAWCKKCIKKIADTPKFCREHYVNTRYRDAWNESYARLSEKRACRLKQRLRKAREDAEKNGASGEVIKDITYLSIIADDKNLKPVYETVIKEMMIAYYVTENQKEQA